MTRPYSLDLRERVVAFVGEGQSRRSAASLFKIGISTVVRWCQRADATGSAAAKPMGGKRPSAGGRARLAVCPARREA